MSDTPHPFEAQESPTARGHTIGFVETQSECAALILALNQAGYPGAQIMVFDGEAGVPLLESMLEGSLWGESAEEVLKQGTMELRDGHSVVCVEVQDAEEAATVAAVSTQHGGYSVYHFGSLVDTRLTA